MTYEEWKKKRDEERAAASSSKAKSTTQSGSESGKQEEQQETGYEAWKKKRDEERAAASSSKAKSTTQSGSESGKQEEQQETGYEAWKKRRQTQMQSEATDRVNQWLTEFRRFSDAYNARYRDKSQKYRSDSAYWLENVTKSQDRMRDMAQEISKYMEENRRILGNVFIARAEDMIWEGRKFQSSVVDQAREENDYYSQWENEDAFNLDMQKLQKREELLSFDTDAGKKEIDELKRRREELVKSNRKFGSSYLTGGSGLPESTPYAAAKQGKTAESTYAKDIRELNYQIGEREKYINLANREKAAKELSGVKHNDDFKDYSGYSSTKSDDFIGRLTSKFSMGYDDLDYEYINGAENGMRDEIIKKAVSYDYDTEKFFIYDYMTEDQISIYNYHYAKDGKDTADKYLDSIRESLNLKSATERFQKMEDKTAVELLFGIEAGVDQWQSGIKNALGNRDGEYVAPSAIQMASGMVRQDLEEKSKVARTAYDLITTTSNMAPSILTSTVTNILLPGSGAVVGSVMMGGSAGGSAYQEMINEGYSKEQAKAYGTLVGASETVLGSLLGGISSLGGKLSGNAVGKLMSKVDNAVLRTAIKIGGNMVSEGLEEGLQEILTPWFKSVLTGEEYEVATEDVLYASLLGALSAGLLEGPTTISEARGISRQGAVLRDAGITADRLAEIGKTFAADTVAYQLAGRVDGNTDAYTMARLFNELDAELTRMNEDSIVDSLISKGVDERSARKLAEGFGAVVTGTPLTDRQKSAIAMNNVLAETVRETIIDPNSTVNQRSHGFNDLLHKLAQDQNGVTPESRQVVADTKEESSDPSRMAPQIPGQENVIAGSNPVTASNVDVQRGYEAPTDTDDGTGLIRQTVADMGLNESAANVLVDAFGTDDSVDAETYATGIREAYRYGQFNYPAQEVAKGPFSSLLTEHQRNTAYKLGQMFGSEQAAKAQATVLNNRTGKNSLQVGKVHFDGDRKSLTERQRTSLSTLETVADVLGVQIHVFESQVDENGKHIGANGWYDPKDSSIHIDLHAGANGEGTMLFTAAHEMTHYIKRWSPEKFKTMSDFLMTEYGEKGVSIEELVQNQIAKAERNGRTISYDKAFEEVIADSMETMLSDGKVVEKLAKLKQQDKGLWQKMKDFISQLAVKIREAYEGVTPDSQEGRLVAEMKDSVEKLQELFTEGLVEASENFQASLTPGEEGIVTNQNGDPVAYSTEDGTVLLSMRTYEEDGREAFRKYLQKCVKSEKLTQTEMQEMLSGIEEIYGVCKEFKDKYAPFSSWSDAAVVRDTHGRPVFSVVTPNGDYKMNLDFSLVCKKRRTLDAVFNEMSRRGIIDDFELGQKSVVRINEIIRKYGLETACALCFVDAKRFRQASMADSFTGLYNELVESLVPEAQKGSIDHFNFSGYDTIKKVEGGIDTWDNSKLDFSHLDKVMKEYGSGTVEHKAAKYIKSHPEGRKLLLRGDFMASQGFDAVKTQNRDILKLYNSKKGTGGPKAAFGDVQYMNEIIKKARTWTPKKAYEVGGIRIQSFSDYVPRMVFDYVQMIYDLAATKLPAHAYTKEALFVKQFGLTGVKINMSLIPAITEGGIAPGLDANGNYVWAGESFDFETAKQIQNADGYTENCGTICVGVSRKHIEKLLDDPDIRMVIPYHKSGLNPIVAHMNKIAEFEDYTNKQNTTVKETGSKAEENFDFNKALHDMGESADPRAVIRQYFDWCDAQGYDPKFAEFRYHPNYYKLIEDFTLYDRDGNYVPQREVKAVFPKADSAFGSMKDLIKEGLEEDAVIEGKRDSRLSAIVDEIQNTLPRTEAEISEEQVEQADRDLEAEVKYSFRGINPDGIEVYETSEEIKKLPYTERQKRFLNIMENDYRGRTAKFIRNGHAYYATFDEKDVNKNIYGDKLSDKKGWKAKTNVGADGDIFELVENARYNGSLPEKGKKNTTHRGVGYWDYFIKNVQIDGTVFDLVANVRKKADGAFVYSIQLKENKKIKASPPRGSLLRALNGVTNASANTVTQPTPAVKKYSDRDTESVSNRSLLANAFESVAQNDIERKKLQEYKGKIDQINAEDRKLRELNAQIKELSFAKGKRDTQKIRELRDEAQKTANRITIYDKQLLRLEAAKPLQNVLEREKQKAYQKAKQKHNEAMDAYRQKMVESQNEIVKRYQDARAKVIESRAKTAMRHKIQGVVKELNQYLLNGTKDKHVMEGLRKTVAEALDVVNMDTVGAEERIAKLERELMNAKTPEAIQEISRRIDNVRRMGDRMSDRLKALKDAYREIAESNDPLIANSHDEVIEAKMESVIENVGDTPLRDMNLNQLEEVYDMYRMVMTTIRNANKAFKAAKGENIADLGSRVMAEVEKAGGKRKYSTAAMESVRKFGWNNLKPVYAFEHIGSNTLTQVFNAVRAGEDVWAKDVTDAKDFYRDEAKKHKYNSWDFRKRYSFTSSSGMDFSLSLEQIMSLYAYSKREQAADHLTRGGIVFDESTEVTMKTKLGIPVKFNPTEATAYNLSAETLGEIVGKLTEEQKAFVDEMQDYLSTTMGAKGNEVSMELYGIKLFKEKFYFPLKSATQFMAKAKEQQQGEVKIKNSGFSKETVKKANNPIVLTPFMDVWTSHVNEMSMYHAFVLPMEDFYRVWSYRTATSDTAATESVEMTVQNAYGKGATKYIDQMLKDLNGGARTDSRTGIINTMMGKFKKGAVFASLSVVVQQPSAIARAAALMDTKYFIGPKVDHKRHKALWNEVKQYAPVAIIKEMGYFDTNMGKTTKDFIVGKEYSSISEKMKALVTDSNYRDEVLSKAPALADEIAWCSIWEAVKRETKAKYPGAETQSDLFLKKVGDRFTEIIIRTQVYDSVLSRSANMRSTDTGMKMATAFMAEPTTSINMIADALLKAKRGDTKYARKSIGAVVASQLLNSILVSFVYAARDDDEDETYAEKYVGSLVGEFADSLNPAGYIPFIKDIMSIVQGYDVERSDMAVISDLWNAWQKLDSDNLSVYRKVEGFAGSICQIFGLPVKNIMRDVRGVYQAIDSFVNGQQTTKAGIGYAIKGAISGKTVSDQQQLYEAYLRGDQTQIDRVESRYKDQSAVDSAIRKALRENDPRIRAAAEARINGDIAEYTRIAKEIVAEKHFSQDNVVAAINAEINTMNKGGGSSTTTTQKETGLYKMSDFEAAVIAGDATVANAIRNDIIQTAQKNGKTVKEAEESFARSAGSSCRELFMDDSITKEQAIRILTTYCGKAREEADLQIQVYDWEKEVPGCDDITASAIREYNENCKNAGISKSLYYKAWSAYNDTDADYDENGDTIRNSKTQKVMRYINNLSLTKEQKNALAMCWYAESTVQKYKLW